MFCRLLWLVLVFSNLLLSNCLWNKCLHTIIANTSEMFYIIPLIHIISYICTPHASSSNFCRSTFSVVQAIFYVATRKKHNFGKAELSNFQAYIVADNNNYNTFNICRIIYILCWIRICRRRSLIFPLAFSGGIWNFSEDWALNNRWYGRQRYIVVQHDWPADQMKGNAPTIYWLSWDNVVWSITWLKLLFWVEHIMNTRYAHHR